MMIPAWLLTCLVSGCGIVVFFSFRYVLQLIRDNKTEDDRAREGIKNEMRELRNELHVRVNNSETKLLEAIKLLPRQLVSQDHCDNKQEIWGVHFSNLINTIETARETQSKIDESAHKALIVTQEALLHEVTSLKECVNNLANKKDC